MHKQSLIALIWMLTCVAGCQSLNGGKKWFGKEEEVNYGTPNKVVAIWTNAVHNQSGYKPTRGLGGRLYFYDAHHKPVQVNGSLTVFVYDDTDPAKRESQESTRKLTFNPEQVATLYTPSDFGPSYSVWVPWDEVGGERRHLSVIPVFTDQQGQMLAGDQAQHVLPGVIPDEIAIAKEDSVSTADYVAQQKSSNGIQQASAAADVKQVTVKSSTIKLPASMQERIRRQASVPQRRRNSYLDRATSWTRTQLSEPRSTQEASRSDKAAENKVTPTSNLPRSAHSALRPHRAPTSRSEQPGSAPAPRQPAPAG
jgi:hypothetical protein